MRWTGPTRSGSQGTCAVNFSFDVIFHNFPYLLGAAKWTVLISLVGMAISILLGIFVCAARISGRAWLRLTAAVYISFFRGVPLLVLLLLSLIHISEPTRRTP